jgi:predicted secreted Zn-dependent protease
MKYVNFRERWVYRGSLTVPPCTQFIYWSVINDVFPIDQDTVTAFRNQLRKSGPKVDQGGGNYKVTAYGMNKEVYYIGSSGATTLMTSIYVALAAALLVLTI